MTTVFTNHFKKKTSFITTMSFSLFTSYLTASTCSLANLLNFCFLGGNDGSILSRLTMDSESTPDTSYGLQANTFTFFTNNNNISTLSLFGIPAPIWKLLFSYGNILTLISSSAQLAPFSPKGSYNCYKGTSSADSFCFIFQLIAATMHYLATC